MEADFNNVLMSCRNLDSPTLVETDLVFFRLRRGMYKSERFDNI